MFVTKGCNKKQLMPLLKIQKIDILVNAVGGFDKLDSIEDINDQEWLKVIDLNLNSAFYCNSCFSIMKKMIQELLILSELASHQIRSAIIYPIWCSKGWFTRDDKVISQRCRRIGQRRTH